MPNKTIYVSEEDLPLYERTQELAGGNLSAAITRALRRFVALEEHRQQGYQEVRVRVGTGKALRTQRFSGVLLGEWRHPTAQHRIEIFQVYRTPKGRFALYRRRSPNWAVWANPEGWQEWGWEAGVRGWWGPLEATFEVFEELEDLRDQVPPEFFELLQRASEQPIVEDLDI
jgi:EXLDI family protein